MKILIVDDKQDARYLLEVLLQGNGGEVISANNGIEALKVLEHNEIDLIISDILMPEMDGFKFCQIVKKDEKLKNIPFIFYTATYVETKDKELALNLGADLFLIKPMQPDKLLIEIETLMDKLKQGEVEVQSPKLQDEKDIYKLYNERLVNKLEKKIQELEKEIGERRLAEEALQESERRFQVLAEFSPVGIFRTDAQGSTTYVNPRWCNISGLSAGKALGDGWLMAVHPEERNKLIKDWKQATKANKLSVSEYRFVHKDGSIIWVLGQAVPERNIQDQIIGYVGTITDITERKKAEEALKSSEERLNILFEFAPDAYYMTDLKGVFIDGNKAAEEITGYKREELIGKSFLKLNLLSAKELMKASEILMKNVQCRGSGPDELVLNKKNGDKVTVEIRTYPVKIHDKTVVLGIARDITERIRAQEKLRTSETQLSIAMDIAKLGYWEYSVDDDIFTFNDHFYDIFRTTAAKEDGYRMTPEQYAKRFLPPEDVPLVAAEMKKAIETSDPDFSQTLEHRILYADGKPGYISVRYFVVKDESGRTIKTFGVNQDITERKLAEEALRDSETRFRTLFETAGDAIFLMKGNKFITCNEATIKMFACEDKKDILEHEPGDFSPPLQPDGSDSRIKAQSHINAALNGEAQQFYWKHIKKNGTPFDAEVTLNRLNLKGIDYLQAIVRDITKSKKMEDELKDSEIKYHTLFENSSEFLFTIDLKGNFTDVNKAALDLTGYTKPELLKMNFKNYTSTKDHKKLFRTLFNVYKTGKPQKDFFVEALIKDGSTKYFETSFSLLKKGDKIIGYQGSSKDITERRRSEKIQKTIFNISNALNTTENMFDLYSKIKEFLGYLIDTTNFYIALYNEDSDEITLAYVIDEKDVYESFPAGKTLTKYVIKLGKPLFATLQMQNELTEKGLIEILGTPSKIWLGAPFRIENKVIGLIAVQSYEDPDLYTEKDLEILTFVSEEIALAISHKQAEEQIKKDLKEKTALLQELYHRTKNNMQVIVSMLKMQTRLTADQYTISTFNDIISKINAMSLVHQKLYQAKDLSQINLKDYIEDLVYLLRQSYARQASRTSLKFDLEDVFVLIDSAMPLGLIFSELISNIFKHAFPDNRTGEIFIRLHQEEDVIHIHLEDNGIGIPAECDLKNGSSMGLATMFTLVEHQLKGEAIYTGDQGLKWHINFKDTLNKRRV